MENFVSEKVYFKWNNHLTSVLLVVFFPENLGLTTPDYYNYLNQTGTYTFELRASVVIGTDCTGSCKSNSHTITTTMANVQM
jgi:hypothetical protein